MRDLFRRALFLFRQYPILWAPHLAALILSFFCGLLFRLVRHSLLSQIIHWLTQQHSVLGGITEDASPTQAIYHRAEIYTLPLTWAILLFNTFLFTSAMVATAGYMRSLAATGQPSLPAAASAVTSSCRRILSYSLKLLALSIPIMLILPPVSVAALNLQNSLAEVLTLSAHAKTQLEQLSLASYIPGIPFDIFIAWLMAPLAVRLLRPPDSAPAPQEAKLARIATILKVLAAVILNVVVARCEDSVFHQLQPRSNTAFEALILAFAVIRLLPAILLTIALFLIANPSSPLTIPTPRLAEDASLADETP